MSFADIADRHWTLEDRNVWSKPLKAFDKPVGAINIYSRRASPIQSDAGTGVTDDQLALRYQEALRGRDILTMAKGVIMEREGFGEDDAFAAILRLELYQGMPLRGRAEALVLSAKRPELGPEWGLDA